MHQLAGSQPEQLGALTSMEADLDLGQGLEGRLVARPPPPRSLGHRAHLPPLAGQEHHHPAALSKLVGTQDERIGGGGGHGVETASLLRARAATEGRAFCGIFDSMGFRLWRVAVILAAGAALGLLWNAFSGHGFALDRSVFVQAGDESHRGRRSQGPPRPGGALPGRPAGRLLQHEPHPRLPAPARARVRQVLRRSSSRSCARPSTSSSTAPATAARPATSWRESCARRASTPRS